jgi:gamma-glutamylcyclotransferase (GGCT)/AIG2-like uncharacterized protein YtfP
MAFDYFAYASNMAPNVIARLCPRHIYLGVAHLADHRLAFTRRSMKTRTGVADIVQAAGETVWGVLYRIDDNELTAIDRKEGHDWAYKRVMLPVRLEGGRERAAVTYTVRSKEPAQVPPSRQYLDLVIAAARARAPRPIHRADRSHQGHRQPGPGPRPRLSSTQQWQRRTGQCSDLASS